MDLNKVSRFLSLILRHHPEKIGITLDERDASILIRKKRLNKSLFSSSSQTTIIFQIHQNN